MKLKFIGETRKEEEDRVRGTGLECLLIYTSYFDYAWLEYL